MMVTQWLRCWLLIVMLSFNLRAANLLLLGPWARPLQPSTAQFYKWDKCKVLWTRPSVKFCKCNTGECSLILHSIVGKICCWFCHCLYCISYFLLCNLFMWAIIQKETMFLCSSVYWYIFLFLCEVKLNDYLHTVFSSGSNVRIFYSYIRIQ